MLGLTQQLEVTNTELKDEESRVLSDLGLTVTQARAYLSLCRLGASQSNAISKESKIARQDIYRVLLSLQEIGLIEKVLGSPALFTPIPLQDAIDVLMEQRALKSRDLHEETQKLLQNYRKSNERIVIGVSGPQFVLVPQGRASMLKAKNAIMAAQKSIECVTACNRFIHMMFVVGEEIVRALGRGVKCRFVLGKPENNNSFSNTMRDLCKKPSCEVRYIIDPPRTVMTRFDDKELLIATSTNGGFLQSSMLWSNDLPLLSMTHDYFDTMWVEAIKDLSVFSKQNPFDTKR